MHICYLGGTGPFLRELAEGVASHGLEVSVIAFYDSSLGPYYDPTGWAGSQVITLPHELKWQYPRAARRIAAHLRELRPDVFHCHYVFPYGLYGGTSLHSNFVLSLHGSDASYAAWKVGSKVTRRLDTFGIGRPAFSLTHRLLALRAVRLTLGSPDLIETARKLGYPQERLRECDIGVDARVFHPGAPDTELRHRLLSPIREGNVLLSVRGFKGIYGYDDLLYALLRVLIVYPDTVLVLAGTGDTAAIRNLAGQLGIDNHVRIVGPILHGEVARYMRASDILCSVAYSDTTSMSVLEGMAVGLPVVATKVGSIPLRISKTKGGVLVDPGDRAGIARAVLALLGDADLRRTMGKRNASYMSTHLSLDNTVRQTLSVYEEIA